MKLEVSVEHRIQYTEFLIKVSLPHSQSYGRNVIQNTL